MITISSCPITGLTRKLEYDLLWYRLRRTLIVGCTVFYFDESDEQILTQGIKPYYRELIATDTLVNPSNGAILTQEQILQDDPSMQEYDFYVTVIAESPVIVSDLIESVIQLRDSEGKFNV